MSSYVLTIVSAMLAHGAYTWPKEYGFLVLIAGVTLWWVLYCCAMHQNRTMVFWSTLKVSMLWGAVFYTAHFSWLFELLHTKSQASVWGSLGMTGCVILNFVLIFTLCCHITTGIMSLFQKYRLRLVASIGWFLIMVGLYGHIVRQWSLWFTGALSGYPLLTPSLPLVTNQFLRSILLVWSSFWGIATWQEPPKQPNIELPFMAYLKPLPHINSTNKLYDPLFVGAYIGDQIQKIQDSHTSLRSLLIIGPESTLPFSLNAFPVIVSGWQAVLQEGTDLIIGGFRRDEYGCCYQSVYHIDKSGVRKSYDKQHCMPFNEQVPSWWDNFEWAHALFLTDAHPISIGKADQDSVFRLRNNSYVLPVVCSEIFDLGIMQRRIAQAGQEGQEIQALLWLVNDSWFAYRMKRLLYTYSFYASLVHNKKVVYVGHDLNQF